MSDNLNSMKPYLIFGSITLIVILLMWLHYEEKTNESSLAIEKLKGEKSQLIKDKVKLTARVDVTECDLKATSDTLRNERAKDRKNVIVKFVYRDKLRDAANNDLQQAPETITRLVTADDSLTITFMKALDKCESGYDTLETKFFAYKSASDSLLQNSEDRNVVSDSIIQQHEKALKRARRISKLKSVAIPVAFVIGILVVI